MTTQNNELREKWLKLVDNYFPKDKRHARGQATNMTDEVIQVFNSEVLASLDRLKAPTMADVFPSKPYDGTNTYEDMLQVVRYYETMIEAERKRYE